MLQGQTSSKVLLTGIFQSSAISIYNSTDGISFKLGIKINFEIIISNIFVILLCIVARVSVSWNWVQHVKYVEDKVESRCCNIEDSHIGEFTIVPFTRNYSSENKLRNAFWRGAEKCEMVRCNLHEDGGEVFMISAMIPFDVRLNTYSSNNISRANTTFIILMDFSTPLLLSDGVHFFRQMLVTASSPKKVAINANTRTGTSNFPKPSSLLVKK